MISDGFKGDGKVKERDNKIETLQSRINTLEDLLDAKNSLVNAMPANTLEKVTPS